MRKELTTIPKEFNITEKETIVIKNISLEGLKTLRAEKVITTWQIVKEVNPITKKPEKIISKLQANKKVEPLLLKFVEAKANEINYRRNSKIPSFVLKVDGKLYCTDIPDNVSFDCSTILGLYNWEDITSDRNRWCEKFGKHTKKIEKISCVLCGYEIFNTKYDTLVIAKCSE